MKVVFLVPNPGVPGNFWDVLVAILRAAAQRLTIELEVVDSGKNVDRMIALGAGLARRSPPLDCVLLPNYLGAACEIVPALDAGGVRAFLVPEGMKQSDRLALGGPREKHLRWIGEMFPDEVAAGHLLARLLTERARAGKRVARDGKIHVGVLTGDQTSAGQARFQGWLNLRKEQPDVVQASVQNAGWGEAEARAATTLLLRNHPEVTVIWAANDSMALGALDAVRYAGKEPGADVLIGGMDLLPRALQRVADGGMAVTLGGHVLDGARALLLVHDHLRGQDFAPTSLRSALEPVTSDLAPAYLRFFEQRAWERVEFERYSRALHPRAAPLTLAALVER